MSTQEKAPASTGADAGAAGAVVCPHDTTIRPGSQAPIKRLAAFFVTPDPGQAAPTPEDLGDPIGYGEFALAVHALQHGATPDDLLKMLAPYQRAAIWAQDPTRPADQAARTTWKHDDLLAATFEPQTWAVEGLVIGSGLTWLGGVKKLGKSLFAIQAAWEVASGGVFLGKKCAKGKVFYLALEDGGRRLQTRLKRQESPKGLDITYITRYQPLDQGGLDDLRSLLEAETPAFLILDTLAACKSGRVDENEAGAMGDLANSLRILAQDHHCAILVVVHHGKVSQGDPGFDIRGSSAQGGASDVNLGLYRTEGGYILKGEGRDFEPVELRLALDIPTLTWGLVGDARKLAKEENENELFSTLSKLKEADAKTLAGEMGKSRQAVHSVLRRLEGEGKVTSRGEQAGKGRKILYRILEPKE